MKALESQLLDECRKIAEQTLYNYDKAEHISAIWSTEDREKLAQRYFEAVKEGIKYVTSSEGRDPYAVLRAVRYLAVHAIPPMRDRVDWFREGLQTLLVLAFPFAGTPPGGEPFFNDIRRGIAQAEAWGKQSKK